MKIYQPIFSYVRRLVLITLLSLAGFHASTVSAGDYDYVQMHVLQSKYEGLGAFRLQGLEIRGGFSRNQWFTEFRYRDLRDKPDARELNEDRWSASVGYAFPSSGKTHYDVRLNFGDENIVGTSPQGDLRFNSKFSGVSSFVH
ncbi:MAG: hypothetical protein AB8B95_10815 [Pseudohongiellaceae bacterium]